MSFIWNLHENKSSYLIVSALVSDGKDNSSIVYKNGTTPLTKISGVSSFTGVDQHVLIENFLYVSIPSGTSDYANYFSTNNYKLDYDKVDYSYLYAEVELYGDPLSDKKDILSRNESLDVPRWEVKREFGFEDDFSSLGWLFDKDYTGSKRIKFPMTNINDYAYGITVKYDGSVHELEDLAAANPDECIILNGHYFIVITDTDSGWGEGYTPTSAEMSANFYNWRLCDGTFGTPYNGTGTKTWYPKGDADLSRAVTTVPTSNAPTIAEGLNENYFLLYELAESIEEPVTVEGSLSISGDAQVSISEGFIREEPVLPYLYSGSYRISDNQRPSTSWTKYKTDIILKIYKNRKDDTFNWNIDNINAYGNQRAWIEESKFDTSAVYTLDYTVHGSEKYQLTTNLNEVKATYHNSIKSSIYSMVAKQSDQGTDISILNNQMLRVLIALRENNIIV